MNRLLSLQQNLISGPSFFEKHRQSSTIDSQEFKRIVYGPNYQHRERSLEFIKQNPDVFEHYHVTEASRDKQR
jgi:hypothetical protein